MKQELNIAEILKDCPEGTKLYATMLGEVTFLGTKNQYDDDSLFVITIKTLSGYYFKFTKEGKYTDNEDAECVLFPSKDQRDWSKFVVPKPDLPEGTWVMCGDSWECCNTWRLRQYCKQGKAYHPWNDNAVFWKYIIPFDKFDPNNIEECIKKYNYGTKQN